MAKDARIYQLEDHGWFVELGGQIAGPLDTATDARDYVSLLEKIQAARTEVACLDAECFI
ncbi:MAG: hypothetical protein OEZ39_02180 [Gammaproteobacteria bacterium]|nr:hypothetical protein [Gammaproteobacteria bacterium]MDH5650662.1 hypothetical protein [Gammaproteobacteria bacterium]